MTITTNKKAKIFEKSDIMNTSFKQHKNLITQSLSHSVTSSKNAFTLAEVLITLGVIGVVAALIMPALIKELNNTITVSKLKKSYAEISQMANNIKLNTGCETLECTGLLTDFSLEKFVEYAGLKNAKIYYTNWNWTQPLYCEKEACEDRTGLT